MNRIYVLFLLLISAATAFSQKLNKSDKAILANLKAHIGYLADDALEGRRAGTPGEWKAAEYIIKQFMEIGITPGGSWPYGIRPDQTGLKSVAYHQRFDINEGKQMNESSYFIINDKPLVLGKDFFPFPFSSGKVIDASPAIALQEADMPWFVDLKETLAENSQNPHFDLNDYIRTNIKKAYNKGASALILYNTSATSDGLSFNAKDKTEAVAIPVVYVTKEAAGQYFADATATLHIKIKADISEKKRTGNNVVGFIDNGAPTTVVLGAHFDHLGYGEDNNSMLRTGEKLIHNGADDNASGTAALIELARILKKSKAKKNNYLFIAFSGEELGLFGSKYFVENASAEQLKTFTYMINMDMVGRLNDSTKALAIGGYGTSPQWADVIRPQDKKLPFIIKLDSSGTGPSDHTSFYRKDIPVLFFFTGQHRDYHRPTDDADRINYEGELQIIKYIDNIITELDAAPKLAFTKTREVQVSTSSFRVTLGIMPDYTYSGTGVRADGVSEGRPAAKAGLKAGDVILQLGDHAVSSVETYMQALNKFSKGEKTKVKFKRGSETLEAEVQF